MLVPGGYAGMRTKSGRKLVVIDYLGPEHSRVRKWRGSAKGLLWAGIETVPTAELSPLDPVADSRLIAPLAELAAGKALP